MKFVDILNWSQISFDNLNYFPIFFFYPTIEILSYIEQFGYQAIITIRQTDKIYDGRFLVQFNISQPSTINPTVDFQTKKPIYSAIINIPFTIYPCQKGQFLLESIIPSSPSFNQNDIKETFVDIPLNDDTSSNNDISSSDDIQLSSPSIITQPIGSNSKCNQLKILMYIIFILFLFIFVLLFIYIR